MLINSKLCDWAKGRVIGYFVNPVTGEKRDHFEINNVTAYGAADIMARLLGGESNYVPSYMGFVYGASASPGAALV